MLCCVVLYFFFKPILDVDIFNTIATSNSVQIISTIITHMVYYRRFSIFFFVHQRTARKYHTAATSVAVYFNMNEKQLTTLLGCIMVSIVKEHTWNTTCSRWFNDDDMSKYIETENQKLSVNIVRYLIYYIVSRYQL